MFFILLGVKECLKGMKIQKISIEKFKGLKDFEVVLSDDNYVSKFNLSIIIGENATFKTTLLELMLDFFKELRIDKEAKYAIHYEFNGKNYVGRFEVNEYIKDVTCRKIHAYSFSYALIDRLRKLDKKFSSVNSERQTIGEFSKQLFLNVNRKNKYQDVNKILNYLESSIDDLQFLIVSKRRNTVFKVRIDEFSETLFLVDKMVHYMLSQNEQTSIAYRRYLDGDLEAINRFIFRKKTEDLRIYFSSLDYHTVNIHKVFQLAIEGEYYYIEKDIVSRHKFFFQMLENDDSLFNYNGDAGVFQIKAKHILNMFIYFIYIQENMSAALIGSTSNELNSKRLALDYVHAQEIKRVNPQFVDDAINLYENVFRIPLVSSVSLRKYGEMIDISDLSSGELSFGLRSIDLLDKIQDNSIVLIDEPEVHLHPKWIKSYVSLLDELFSNVKSHFIITTHSPVLVNNVYASNLIVLRRERDLIKQIKVNINPFAKELDELLKEVFYTDITQTKIIDKYIKETSKLIKNKKTRLKGIEKYEKLDSSATKMKLFLKYYSEIEGIDTDD